MMRQLQLIAAALVGAFLLALGWWAAHAAIVFQCNRLTAFYVGDQVFTCLPPSIAVKKPQASE